ncbi:MFS transporter [Legionella shakespearei]|uniref:Multidrug efflux system protein n=1 Tax=Legionella shakespearei DSM 23087 TaxID=1122169 RepID=A0A0W0YXC1_9GAMM|nr:MFS transporter [Legionella shakespearei]KTD61483.1 multidrug efflux system protein [Legionella shakespearei DSM 23087]
MALPLIYISRKQGIAFACFLVFYEFLTYIANDMIMPGMISVVKSFSAPESTVATSLTIYILGGASLQLILGPVADTYGRRPMMLLGAFLFFLFTILIACSNSMNQFLAARFFQGMGLCFIGVIGYATIQEIFEEMDAIRLIAIMANAAILAPLLGPVLGALVIYYTSWRVIFIVIAAFAVFALWGLWAYMPEPIGQIKRDGQQIPKAPFSPKAVFKNYWLLVSNLPFSYSTLAIGLVGIPCLAWIALAPVILIAEGKLTVIQYGLWQLPIFGATILGNWFLHRLTYKYKIKSIIFLGSVIMTAGMVLMALLPYLYGEHYQYLLPGIIIYFFSLSVITAPLNRHCLFVTSVTKGTASALISLGTMVIGALGIEFASMFYHSHSNLYFALCCNLIGLLYLFFVSLAFYGSKD